MIKKGLFSSLKPVSAAPWPRYVVDREIWEQLAEALSARTCTLLGLWGDHASVHMCLMDEKEKEPAIATLPVPRGKYPSVARRHLPALRMERAIADLFGMEAEGCPDRRPWLDHGRWPVQNPMASSPAVPAKAAPVEYSFLPVEGDGIHQIPVGPIHAGIIEPGHFRFSANGEMVVRLEERLGYTHKGVEKLLDGADLTTAARIAGRVSGDSTVAYSFAFAQAVESAVGITAPPRAKWLRALMAELERIANHFGDIGAICNDASFSLLHTHFGVLREETLRHSEACFGHRLMMDCIIPGGAAIDPDAAAIGCLAGWLEGAEKRLDEPLLVYDRTASLKDRTNTTGVVPEDLVRLYGAGGYVGRASGRAFDVRKNIPYPPYDVLTFDIVVLRGSDVNARLWTRANEIKQSFILMRQILGGIPEGKIVQEFSLSADKGESEGVAMVEGFRGDVLAWIRLGSNGRIARCYLRDPSWFQWPLLEAAIRDNIVADFPLCNKSFNCSYSGHDL